MADLNENNAGRFSEKRRFDAAEEETKKKAKTAVEEEKEEKKKEKKGNKHKENLLFTLVANSVDKRSPLCFGFYGD